jgi:hypothetical protein
VILVPSNATVPLQDFSAASEAPASTLATSASAAIAIVVIMVLRRILVVMAGAPDRSPKREGAMKR